MRNTCCVILALVLTQATPPAVASNQDLPVIGDTSSGVVSVEEERELGKDFLRSLRSQVPTVSDPLLKEYLENLVYRLAQHSQLQDRHLQLVIIDSRQLNAFAAPGGIVGVNVGAFIYADTENELAAILAHELAHLSQRHFARQTDRSRRSTVTTLAGMLAGIVLMATTGGDAGLAAMTASQGLAEQSMLRYSRSLEAEADRVGIQTLAESGMDPNAMAYSFEQLARINRFAGERVPEFLLTHPVNQARIADSYNQAAAYPRKTYGESLDYQLMRERILVRDEGAPEVSIKRLQAETNSRSDVRHVANRYGLALALIRANRFEEAAATIRPLRDEHPDKIAFVVAEAELDRERGEPAKAADLLESHLKLSPDNLPLTVDLADTLLLVDRADEAEDLLERVTAKRPNDADLWYQLAETYGKAGNIVGVHQARAEFFVLNGNFDQAVKQLGYALPLVADNFQMSAKIHQRIRDIQMMRGNKQQ